LEARPWGIIGLALSHTRMLIVREAGTEPTGFTASYEIELSNTVSDDTRIIIVQLSIRAKLGMYEFKYDT